MVIACLQLHASLHIRMLAAFAAQLDTVSGNARPPAPSRLIVLFAHVSKMPATFCLVVSRSVALYNCGQ